MTAPRFSAVTSWLRRPPSRRLLVLTLLIAVLCLATTLAYDARYRFSPNNLLRNADFSMGLLGWEASGEGAKPVQKDGLSWLQAEQREPGGSLTVGQSVPVPPGLHLARFAIDLRIVDVVSQGNRAHRARIVLTAHDARGNLLNPKAHALVAAEGSFGWTHYEGLFFIPKNAATLRTEIQLLHSTGLVEVRNLALNAALVVPLVATSFHILGVLWAVLVVVALLVLARHLPRHGFVIGIIFVLAVAAVLVPRTRDKIVRPVLVESFIDGAALADTRQPILDARAQRGDVAPSVSPSPHESVPASPLLTKMKESWTELAEMMRRYDHLDGYAHAVLLFCVALACLAITGPGAFNVVIPSLFALAVLSEFLQVFSLGRTFSLGDLGSNLLGLAGGIAFYLLARTAVALVRSPGR